MTKKLVQLMFFICLSYSVNGQWQQSAGTAGLNMQSLLTNGTYNFAGGQTGAYVSTDSAANYSLSNTGNDNVGPTRGFTSDSNYIYTCTSQGAFRSSDNGATWVSKSVGLTNLLGSGILKVGTRLFYVGPTGVFKSADQGDNWSAAGLATTDVRCITAINDTLFVGTNGAGIYKSTDWGANWVQINNGLGGSTNFRAIENKTNILFAGGQQGTGVYRSIDFGATWTLLGGGLASSSYRGFASNSQLIVAGSFGAGVFYSTDNGNNWTAINTGLTDLTIFDLELNDDYIVAATNTQGVFRFPLSNLNLSTDIKDIATESNISIFPNPTTDQINVGISLELIGYVYDVYDCTWKSVLTGKLTSEKTIIGLENLVPGIYFIQVGSNNKNVSKIIIK
jgi:photosystem II stability/assembly factor-like uncharacterized protein